MKSNLFRASLLGFSLIACSAPPAVEPTPQPPLSPEPIPPAPSVLTLNRVLGAVPKDVYYSNEITVDWITQPTSITFSGGMLIINGLPVYASDAFVFPGDRVSVALEAPGIWDSTVQSTLTVGDRQGVFAVTTATSENTLPPLPKEKQLRSFLPVPIGGRVTSEAVAHPPYRQPMTVTVRGGELFVDGRQVVSNTAVIDYGQSFRIRLTTPPEGDATVSATAEFNGVTYTFSATTPRSHFKLPAPTTAVVSQEASFVDARVTDMNGDRIDDLVILKTVPDSSRVGAPVQLIASTYLSDGNGHFTTGGSCQDSLALGSQGQVVAKDLNGDANVDLLITSRPDDFRNLQSRLSVCFGDGTRIARPSRELLQVNFRIAKIEAGDIDGDGQQDLVAIDADRRLIWMRNSNGMFPTVQDIAYGIGGTPTESLTVRPVTYNEQADIVVNKPGCHVFSAANGTPASLTQGDVLGTQVVDMDGDSVFDLIGIGAGADRSVTICYRQATGGVSRTHTSQALVSGMYRGGQALRANEDNFSDVVTEIGEKTSIADTAGISVFPNNGKGEFGWLVPSFQGRYGIEYGFPDLKHNSRVISILKGQFNTDRKEDLIILVRSETHPMVNDLYAVSFLKR